MEYILLVLIYTAASLIQGITGFGFGIFSMPMISILFSPGQAVGMNAVLGTVNCVYNYVLLRRDVEYRKSYGIFLLGVLFIPAGAFFLVAVNEHFVFLAMGLMILLVTFHSVRHRNTGGSSRIYGKYGFFFPMLAGLVGGAFFAPGTVLAPYMFARERDPYIARANLQYVFSLMSLVIVPSHVVAGNLNMERFLLALPFVPLVFIFTKLGSRFSFKIKKEFFSIVVNSALLMLGIYILGKNLYALIAG